MKNNLETEIIIQERIKKIEEAVEELKELKKTKLDIFLKEKKLQYAAMFGMILAIEAICDIGSHILAKYFNRSVETYKDIIVDLGECGVIPKHFAEKSSRMTDFRNLLIHVYLKIDPKKVYQNLETAPEEFTKFCQYFLKFLNL